MPKAMLIHPDGRTESLIPSNKSNFSLEEMQRAIDGYIELVRFPNENDRILIVDEDGLSKRLAPNFKASQIAGRFIVGSVIVCHPSMLE